VACEPVVQTTNQARMRKKDVTRRGTQSSVNGDTTHLNAILVRAMARSHFMTLISRQARSDFASRDWLLLRKWLLAFC
jgi:hypothetical protein